MKDRERQNVMSSMKLRLYLSMESLLDLSIFQCYFLENNKIINDMKNILKF